MVRKIAIIGAGNIGIRHLESLVSQGRSQESVIDIFDPSPDRKNEVESIVSSVENHQSEVNIYQSIADGIDKYDVAIFATTSFIRLKVVTEFIKLKDVKNIILEKVVFSCVEDFEKFDALVNEYKLNTYVNCNLRMTDFYNNFKNTVLTCEKIQKFSTRGRSWGLGCNAIHFIDLFSFLTNDSGVKIGETLISGIEDAKRIGYREYFGQIAGNSEGSILLLECGAGDFDLVIKIKTDLNEYQFNDTPEGLIIKSSNKDFGLSFKTSLPYQSGMTNEVVNDLIECGACKLSSYGISRNLHIEMINGFSRALERRGERCQIT